MQPDSLSAPVTPPHARHAQAPLFLMVNNFEVGGTERQFVTVAKELTHIYKTVSPGCIDRNGPLASQVGGAEAFPLGGSFYSPTALLSSYRLCRHLRRSRISIAHAFDFYTNVLMAPSARLARVPVVIGSHRQLGDLLRPAQFRVQMSVFRLCHCVVCNSKAAADMLVRAGLPETKIVVIPNAMPRELATPPAAALSPDPRRIRIGVIARMNSWKKGHTTFIEAAASLARTHRGLEFIFAGDGPLRPQIEALASKAGIATQSRFLGDCRNVPAVLASLDFSVNPSGSESLSNSLVESMAMGVPVIAFPVGGNVELIQDGKTGLLAAGNDASGLAFAMEQFVQNAALRRDCGQAARTYAWQTFGTDHVIKSYIALYDRLLDASAT